MDAITRVCFYFPTCSLTSFWILTNLIISNSEVCDGQTRSLIIAVLVLYCLLVIAASFTDTYTASNDQKFLVLLMPLYGPVCFSLPSDLDKDRVYEFFYVKVRDYVHAVISTTAFLLISIFISPISMCLFPGGGSSGLSSLDSSTVRTVPVLAAFLTALMMMCLGPPRQMLGFVNVEETCQPLTKQMGDNPIYGVRVPAGPDLHMDNVPEGDEEEEAAVVPSPLTKASSSPPPMQNARGSQSMHEMSRGDGGKSMRNGAGLNGNVNRGMNGMAHELSPSYQGAYRGQKEDA